MFINGPRSEQAIQNELEAVEEYCSRMFGISVDFDAFQAQVREIIQQRISDYIYQRFRDWPVVDLLAMEKAVTARTYLPEADPQAKPVRGRRAAQEA